MSDNRPLDFGQFCDSLGKELSEVPIAAETETLPMRSTDFADLYGIHISSIGPYTIYGYLSIPKGDGPFPVIYYVPKNASVLEIIPQGTSNQIRSRYITFSLACRGMRTADSPYAAMYPGQLTEGIESLSSYIYRAVVADTLRGLDFLLTCPMIDKSAIVAWGNDNALLAGALHGAVTHIVSTPSFLYDTINQASRTSSYPLEEFNDYLRHNPERKGQISEILSYYDLRFHSSAITAESLIMADYDGGLFDKKTLRNLTENMNGAVTVHPSERSSYKDGMFCEKWITDKLFGKDATPIVPNHWKLE